MAKDLAALRAIAASVWDDMRFELDNENASNTSRELGASWRGYVSNLAAIPAALGSESAQEYRDRLDREAATLLEGSTLPQSYKDVGGVGDAAGYVTHLAAQSAPYAAEFVAGTRIPSMIAARSAKASLAGTGATEAAVKAAQETARQGISTTSRMVGGVAASYPSSVGTILSAQDEQNGEYNVPSAAALAVPYAAINALGGPELIAARGLPVVAAKTALRRTGISVAGGAASEGLSEGAQQVIEEYGRTVVDPTHDILGTEAARRYSEAMIGGAAMGGTLGVAHRSDPRAPTVEQPKPDAQPADGPITDERYMLPPPSDEATQYTQAKEAMRAQYEAKKDKRTINDRYPYPENNTTTQSRDVAQPMLDPYAIPVMPDGRVIHDDAASTNLRAGGLTAKAQDVAPTNDGMFTGATPETVRFADVPFAEPGQKTETNKRPQASGSVLRALRAATGGTVSNHVLELAKLVSDKLTTNTFVDAKGKPTAAQKPEPGTSMIRGADVLMSELAVREDKVFKELQKIEDDRQNGANVGKGGRTRSFDSEIGRLDQQLKVIDAARGIVASYKAYTESVTQKPVEPVAQPVEQPAEAFTNAAPLKPKLQANPAPEVVAKRAGERSVDAGTMRATMLREVIADNTTEDALTSFQKRLRSAGLPDNLSRAELAAVTRHGELKDALANIGALPDAPKVPATEVPYVDPAPWNKPTPAAPAEKLLQPQREMFKPKEVAPVGKTRLKQALRDRVVTVEDGVATPEVDDLTGDLFENAATPEVTTPEVEAPKAEAPEAATPEETEGSRHLRQQLEERIDAANDRGAITPKEAGKLKQAIKKNPSVIGIAEVSRDFNYMLVGKTRRLKTNDEPAQGLSEKAVQAVVDRATKHWKSLPRILVVDLESETLNLGTKAGLRWFGVHRSKGALVDMNGEPLIVLNVANLNPGDILPTLYHEALGHFGLQKAYGTELTQLMQDIYNSTPEIRSRADAYLRDHPDDYTGDNRFALAAEEVIVTQYSENGLIGQSWWNRIKAAIIRIARRMGWYDQRFSEAEIISIVRKGQRAAMTDDGNLPPPSNTRHATQKQAAARMEASKPAPGAAPREATTDEEVRRRVEAMPIPPEMQAIAISAAINVRDASRKFVSGMTFGRDLRTRYEKVIPSIRDYFVQMARKTMIVQQYDQEVDQIMVDADRLSTVEQTAVSAFLKKSTQEQKWGFVPSWNKKATIDAATAVEYQKLSPAARSVVERVFEHGHKSRKQLRDVVIAAINNDIDEAIAEAQNAPIKMVDGQPVPTKKGMPAMTVTELRKLENWRRRKLKLFNDSVPELTGPYAPLRRFGNYIAVGKSSAFAELEARPRKTTEENAQLEEMRSDAEHYAVFFEPTMGAAEARKQELAKSGKFDHTDYYAREAFHNQIHELPWLAMQKFRSALEQEIADKPKDGKRKAALREVEGLLRDLYIDSLAEASSRKHDMRRMNVAGASNDMLRAFATKGKSEARFIAAIENSGKMTEIINQMRDEVRSQPGRLDASDALNEVLERHAMSMSAEPPSVLVDKALSATSLWTLLMSPRYFAMNATQPFMMSLPIMASRFEYTRSAKEIVKAYGDLNRSLTDGYKTFFAGKFDIAQMKDLPEDERNVLHYLRANALLDVGLSYELGHWETGAGGLSKKMAWVMHTLRTLARQIEVMNRVTTGLAAYRLEKSGGASTEVAQQYAEDLIAQTHGDYSSMNAPRLFNKAPRIATQFRKYQLVQASLLVRLGHEAFKGASADDKFVARKALSFLMAQQAVITGGLGVPAVGLAAYVVSAMFGDDDEPANGEKMLRDAIGDDKLADLLLHGAPAALGADISGNLGMGNVFNPLPYTDVDLTSRDGFESTVFGALGPFFGLARNMAQAAGYMKDGDYWKGLEMSLPSGLKNGMRAYRLAMEGASKDNGDVLLSRDEISAFEAALQAVGFTPTQIQNMYRNRNDMKQYQDYYDGRTKQIKLQYTKAAKANDVVSMSDAREQWVSLQASKKRNGFKPTPIGTLLQAPMEQRKRERKTFGGVQYTESSEGFVKDLRAD